MAPSFKQQLRQWKSVIFALFLRELQSKFNDKLGLGWAFAEPFLFVFTMAYVRSIISGHEVHSMPIILFMMIGLISVQSFTTGMGTISTASKRNKPLFAFRQVLPLSAFITTFIVEFSIKIGVIILCFVASYLLQLNLKIDNLLLLTIMFSLLWVFSFGFGVSFAIGSAFIPELDKVKSLISRPVFFISGTFFSLQDLSPSTWHWLNWNPILHYIEIARYACYESYGLHGVSIKYAVMAALTSLFLALSLYQITWKRVLSQ